jgi:hypothetical protein
LPQVTPGIEQRTGGVDHLSITCRSPVDHDTIEHGAHIIEVSEA